MIEKHCFKKRKGSKRLWLQGSGKFGCQAKSKSGSNGTYPDNPLPDTANMTPWHVNKHKVTDSDEEVKTETKFF